VIFMGAVEKREPCKDNVDPVLGCCSQPATNAVKTGSITCQWLMKEVGIPVMYIRVHTVRHIKVVTKLLQTTETSWLL
jgi:hypothetical protein